jgi:hypothetical protein
MAALLTGRTGRHNWPTRVHTCMHTYGVSSMRCDLLAIDKHKTAPSPSPLALCAALRQRPSSAAPPQAAAHGTHHTRPATPGKQR